MKHIERLKEAERNRTLIYEYLEDNRNVSIGDVVRDLNLSKNKVTHYLGQLEPLNHITKAFAFDGRVRYAVYNLGKTPYIPRVIEDIETPPYKELPLPPEALAVCRVFKMSTVVPPPREKKKHEIKPHPYGGMQSGVSLFLGW